MPRIPIVIFNPNDDAGTILTNSTSEECGAFIPFENNPERRRAQQLKEFGSTRRSSNARL
jgi:hypothetical protein